MKKLIVFIMLLIFTIVTAGPGAVYAKRDKNKNPEVVNQEKGKGSKGPNEKAIENANEKARFKRCEGLDPNSQEFKDCIKKEKDKKDKKDKKSKKNKDKSGSLFEFKYLKAMGVIVWLIKSRLQT
jgi:hypothetical protein